MKPLQERIDALADDRAWFGGWYQPIEFPDGSRTHSTKMSDATFYGLESFGLRKWQAMIAPALESLTGGLEGKRFLEIGCNAGLYLVQARREGAAYVHGVESHPQFYNQSQLVLESFNLDPQSVRFEDARLFARTWNPRPEGPVFDVCLLANALYWVCYSDADGFVPDHEVEMDGFLRNLARIARTVVIIGSETNKHAFGASLADVKPRLEPYFEGISAADHRCDRHLNLITARSRTV